MLCSDASFFAILDLNNGDWCDDDKNLECGAEHTDYEEDIAKYTNLNIIYNLYFKYKLLHPTYIGRKDNYVLLFD